MARMRSFRRRRFRSSQTKWETSRIVKCGEQLLLPGNATCSNAFTDMFAILSMEFPFSSVPEMYPATLGAKRLLFGGLKFDATYTIDPTDLVGGDPNQFPLVTGFIHLWEAIVLVPTAPGTHFAPAYVPIITNAASQGGDVADRVLWKRLSTIPYWGTTIQPGVQLTAPVRDTNYHEVAVKTKCIVDDRHALYYVRSFVHPWAALSGAQRVYFNMYGNLFYRVLSR